MVKLKQLLKRYANKGDRKKLLTDEKIFTLEQYFNKQNERICAETFKDISQLDNKEQLEPFPTSVMMYGGVGYEAIHNDFKIFSVNYDHEHTNINLKKAANILIKHQNKILKLKYWTTRG